MPPRNRHRLERTGRLVGADLVTDAPARRTLQMIHRLCNGGTRGSHFPFV